MPTVHTVPSEFETHSFSFEMRSTEDIQNFNPNFDYPVWAVWSVVSNTGGPHWFVQTESETEALDALVDADKLDGYLIAPEDMEEAEEHEEVTYLGSACEPFNITSFGLATVDPADIRWMVKHTRLHCDHEWEVDPTSGGLIDVCSKCGEERA